MTRKPHPPGTLLLGQHFCLERCPHCETDRPTLELKATIGTRFRDFPTAWCFYSCNRCGGVVTGWGETWFDSGDRPNLIDVEARGFFPAGRSVSPLLPESARHYLVQAQQTLRQPDGCLALCANAVDAMLSEVGYPPVKDTSLFQRIETAAGDGALTRAMAEWAHTVRLVANDVRHPDLESSRPTAKDAARGVDFVEALGEYLFVLPSRVSMGLMSKPTDLPVGRATAGDTEDEPES